MKQYFEHPKIRESAFARPECKVVALDAGEYARQIDYLARWWAGELIAVTEEKPLTQPPRAEADEGAAQAAETHRGILGIIGRMAESTGRMCNVGTPGDAWVSHTDGGRFDPAKAAGPSSWKREAKDHLYAAPA